MSYSNVSVLNKSDESFVTGTITGDNGLFVISGLKDGEYLLKCSYIGYTPKTVPVLIGSLNNTLDVGNVQLEPEAVTLEEVAVMGKRTAVSATLDKKSYSVSDNISQDGRSILDAMKIKKICRPI